MKTIIKYFFSNLEKRIKEETKREIALLISQSGMNKISLKGGDFTGTYWISANGLYKILTGRHLSHDFDEGIIERNECMDNLPTKSINQIP